MTQQSNIIPFKAAKKRHGFRWLAIALGTLSIGGVGAIAGYHRLQAEQTALPTVIAFTPGSAGYFETRANIREPGGYRVIDGDTIEAPFSVKYRLLDYDTPEIFHAKCTEEFALGMAAKERLG